MMVNWSVQTGEVQSDNQVNVKSQEYSDLYIGGREIWVEIR